MNPSSTFCTRNRFLSNLDRIADIPAQFRGKWSWRDLPKTYGIPFDDLGAFVRWILQPPRLFHATDTATAVALMKRGFCYKWTQPSSDRFWFVDAPLAFRGARVQSIDNNYPTELQNVNFMIFDRIDRVEERDYEFLESILFSRINHGKVTVFTLARTSYVGKLPSDTQELLAEKALYLGD